ncbi:MAG: hypothetical protein R2854_21940 [Caldilineaceae bacterium]
MSGGITRVLTDLMAASHVAPGAVGAVMLGTRPTSPTPWSNAAR